MNIENINTLQMNQILTLYLHNFDMLLNKSNLIRHCFIMNVHCKMIKT